MKIAFLGLGNMGIHMARHLVKAGHDVTVWNRTASKAKDLGSHGAKAAASPAEAVRDAEIAITMLADDHALESTVFGRRRIDRRACRKARPISRRAPSAWRCRAAGEGARRTWTQYIAAPVFGRPEAAEAGKLFVVAAGKSDVIEHCKPVLESLGQRLFVIGERPEMANVVKLSGNFLIASVIESLGEAIALARKYGVDPHAYVELLTSSLFSAPVYKTYGGIIADERYSPAGFKMRLGLKDVKLALAAAEAVDAAAHGQHHSRPRAHCDRPRHGRTGLECDRQAGRRKCGFEIVQHFLQRRTIISPCLAIHRLSGLRCLPMDGSCARPTRCAPRRHASSSQPA